MFEGQPKSLYALALANTGERFGYYTMAQGSVFTYGLVIVHLPFSSEETLVSTQVPQGLFTVLSSD